MKFAQGQYINDEGQACVVGALALAKGVSARSLRGVENSSNTSNFIDKLTKKLNLKEGVLDSLINLNDQGRWARLEDRLRRLELLHLVKKYALPTSKTAKIKVTANS